ncbi:hypothetical protein BLOT_005437 [Blomia tropicalis]|nr:hypothetical protein BLOT_005437 [Blomia tropicalis]
MDNSDMYAASCKDNRELVANFVLYRETLRKHVNEDYNNKLYSLMLNKIKIFILNGTNLYRLNQLLPSVNFFRQNHFIDIENGNKVVPIKIAIIMPYGIIPSCPILESNV